MRKPCTDCEDYQKTQIVSEWWGRKSTCGRCTKYHRYWQECQIYKNWQVMQKAEKLQRTLEKNSDMTKDEAIDTVRLYWPIDEGGPVLREAIETLIPELKESKDERIRKELIQYLNDYPNLPKGHCCRDDFFAWIEKQGSQNLANSAKICKIEQNQPTKYSLEQAAHIFLDALSDTPYNNKPVTDAQVITKELLKFLSDAHSYNPNAINEQNPAWSEEDEGVISRITNDLENCECEWGSDKQEEKDWLRTLKDRVQPSQWKPSDEQMEYLAKAITTLGNEGDNKTSAILCELRTDLKKLKEH